jgi:hypothetical protein
MKGSEIVTATRGGRGITRPGMLNHVAHVVAVLVRVEQPSDLFA